MPITVLHLSDIHMGSGFVHGQINPETGVNTRLEDFSRTLSLCIDRALNQPVDLVIFGGDAFPDATPAPYIQEAFASQFRRLTDAGIPTVLLVGNHDQHSQGTGGASLSIYRTLGVPGMIVGDRLTTHRITTTHGPIQVITLPWLNRSTLMARHETNALSLSEINELLLSRLQIALESEIRSLDPEIPTILLAHLMADRANLGAERFLAVGKGFTVPVAFLARPCFDYVALGHVHKHQNLNPDNNPAIVYPGSIERVDFSEEKEAKGYVMVELAKHQTTWEFCPLPARPFMTIEVDLSHTQDPLATLQQAIQRHNINGAVVRLIYRVEPEQLESIPTNELHNYLQAAHKYSMQAELVSQLSIPRLPELGVDSSLDPLSALKTYLEHNQKLKTLAPQMLAAAERLLSGGDED